MREKMMTNMSNIQTCKTKSYVRNICRADL